MKWPVIAEVIIHSKCSQVVCLEGTSCCVMQARFLVILIEKETTKIKLIKEHNGMQIDAISQMVEK